ncbi:anti-repressor SinI family protein [Priestia megaterium]|nr:anti-repressor SinI family protein [Priestia megaterium]
MALAKEAMNSNITKDQFRKFLEQKSQENIKISNSQKKH